MVKIEVEIGGLKFKNPTILASGILDDKPSLIARAIKEGAGGVVTKSITFERREGYKTPIIIGLKCGFLNAVGLANPGIGGVKKILEGVEKFDIPVILSVAGGSIDEFVKISKEGERFGASGIELNLSCPHVKGKGIEIGSDPKLVGELVEAVRGEVKLPVYAKLGLSDKILKAAERALESGANGLVLINTIRGMAIDIWMKRPILSNKFGGLSGYPIHPIAVRVVYEIYEEFEADIIGVGGVEDWVDAIEFILAGAKGVQIGTALAYKGYKIFKEVVDGIKRYLLENNFSSIDDIIGLAHRN